MPRDRRYHGGGGGKDLTPIILGLGEAFSPTVENPYFGKKPGDVPFDMKVDPSALVAKPFTGFLSSRENTEAAQERLALEQRTKQDQIRRTQIIAENTAEEARKREMLKQAGLIALMDFKNATGVSDPTPMSAADPLVFERLYGQQGAQRGIVGSSPYLAATIGGLPTAGAIAGAEGARALTEAEASRNAAAANPGMIQDAYLAGQRKPVLMNEAAQQEIDMRNAQKHGWGHVPIRGLTQTAPGQFIAPTPETHGGYQPTGIDEKGNPTGFGFVPAKPSLPTKAIQLPDGTVVVAGGPKAAAAPAAAPLTPTASPGSGPGMFVPPLSLTPSSFNPAPIQARGALPSLINNWNAYMNRGDIEQQTIDETIQQDPYRGLKDAGEFWWGGPGFYPPAPIIRHPALPLPAKRRLTPAY